MNQEDLEGKLPPTDVFFGSQSDSEFVVGHQYFIEEYIQHPGLMLFDTGNVNYIHSGYINRTCFGIYEGMNENYFQFGDIIPDQTYNMILHSNKHIHANSFASFRIDNKLYWNDMFRHNTTRLFPNFANLPKYQVYYYKRSFPGGVALKQIYKESNEKLNQDVKQKREEIEGYDNQLKLRKDWFMDWAGHNIPDDRLQYLLFTREEEEQQEGGLPTFATLSIGGQEEEQEGGQEEEQSSKEQDECAFLPVR